MQLSLVKEKGNLHLEGMTSDYILSLLEKKYIKDVFIPECKNGETWGARDLLKIDVWVLKRTYSPLTTIGYEIKVDRQDFENDQKWVGYLDLCHQFYFICPAGLIRSAELPIRVGLVWVSASDNLHTKRKAERVEPDIEKLNRLLIYVLMARSKIVANMLEINSQEQEDNLQLKHKEVERAREKKDLAYFVKGHIAEVYEQCSKINQELKGREDNVKRFEERLKQIGIIWDSQNNEWQETMQVDREINLLNKQLDGDTLWRMKNLSKILLDTVNTIENYRKSDKVNE